jgi:hypothetical protein
MPFNGIDLGKNSKFSDLPAPEEIHSQICHRLHSDNQGALVDVLGDVVHFVHFLPSQRER